jgi:hypothetical protein
MVVIPRRASPPFVRGKQTAWARLYSAMTKSALRMRHIDMKFPAQPLMNDD